MATQRLIVLNGNAGAFIDILATLSTSRMVFREDDAAAAVGLQFKSVLDAFATTNVVAAPTVAATTGAEPVSIPDIAVGYDHFRKLLGLPAQNPAGAFNARSADKLLSARSNAAGGTTLRFAEYE